MAHITYMIKIRKKLNELSKYYLSYIDEIMIKTVQTKYHLFYWLLGVILSLEMSSILEQRGITKVELLLFKKSTPTPYVFILH